MNKQQARILFMDYLYDEISTEDKKKLKKYLEDNPSLKEELEELQKTRSLLQKMPSEEPAQKLLMVESKDRSWKQWWHDAKSLMPQTRWGKSALAIAASFLLMIMVGAAAEVHIQSTEAGFTISLGEQPQINESISEEQAEALIDQIREENAAMLNEFAKSINEQNKKQLLQVVQYFEEQRLNDLQLIDQNLDQVQQASHYRWRQTNEYWSELIQTVNLNNEQ
ncbi:MAG: hypothetical protein U5J95_10385 [Balneolaceae bacterium]|nr:hypothetical protein [Balneolaceae bacterium]